MLEYLEAIVQVQVSAIINPISSVKAYHIQHTYDSISNDFDIVSSHVADSDCLNEESMFRL